MGITHTHKQKFGPQIGPASIQMGLPNTGLGTELFRLSSGRPKSGNMKWPCAIFFTNDLISKLIKNIFVKISLFKYIVKELLLKPVIFCGWLLGIEISKSDCARG